MNTINYETDLDEQWEFPPAQTEELPVGLIEDQV
jgi:hypothetical protein